MRFRLFYRASIPNLKDSSIQASVGLLLNLTFRFATLLHRIRSSSTERERIHKPGPGKLYYETDLTELGLMEQDLDLNKELESGRAGKNQYDSEVEQ
jgi:hypothetical protein